MKIKKKSNPQYIVLGTGLFLAVFLWGTHTLLDYLWFFKDTSFFDNFFPISRPHDLLIRFMNASAFILCGMVAGILLQRLTIQKQRTAKIAMNLEITLNSIGDAVIATDENGNITRMNPVAQDLTAWTQDDAAGKPLNEVFYIISADTREVVPNPTEKVFKTGKIVGLANHTLLIAKNGNEYHISDSSAPIRNQEDQITGVVLVFRNITEEYALQEKLLQSQKLDAIGQLAGGIAHDFNNMLGGIMGAAELLERIIPQDPETKEYLDMIVETAERAAGLTSKLLAFARRQPTYLVPVDIHQIINDSVAILKQTIDKRISVEVNLGAQFSKVIGDDSQLQSVLLNLGINASHAMPEGGTLSFLTKITDLVEAQCKLSTFNLTPGTYLQVEIRDTGCGMPFEIINNIFEPFFTTKEQGKGTGLGLAAAHGTVIQHKGSITVYSEYEKGTVFHILLPVTKDKNNLQNKATPILGKGHILLVDDELVMRTTGNLLLSQFGYKVLLAKNGREALDIFKKNINEIDLVILDMIMPEMNGRDCFKEIKKIDPHIRIILSSGFTRKEDLYDLEEKGLAGFIQKPYRSVDLSRIVAKALKK